MNEHQKLLIKVCGMKYDHNIHAVALMNPDFLGFIFYPASPRFVGSDFSMPTLTSSIMKTGVFVDESLDTVVSIATKHHLDYIQLHGHESSDYCARLKSQECSIIKAFSIDDQFNFTTTDSFQPFCDYFLFDTKGINPGGNGVAFDWEVLARYTGQVPFFLSGGIGPASIDSILKFHHPKMAGLDLNSRFESEPGKKDAKRLQEFIQNILKPTAL